MNRFIVPTAQSENTVTICITDVLGDKFCVVCQDGKRVYEHIAAVFNSGKRVRLSFKNGEDVTSAFLAEAFFRLYANYPEELVDASLSIADVNSDDAADIECIIQDVKDFLKHPQRFRDAIVAVMGEDSL
jgi:hypothetical protein